MYNRYLIVYSRILVIVCAGCYLPIECARTPSRLSTYVRTVKEADKQPSVYRMYVKTAHQEAPPLDLMPFL